ncbi:MAG: tRNA pseudouridine(55) synthase TruB [Salinibacter sp.]
MSSAAAQRDIPPEMVYAPLECPTTWQEGAILPVDKPTDLPSFDVVEIVRQGTGVQKVGHAGTLDPMATGLLIILVARPATRLQEACMHLPKTYEATLRLGETTASHDTETEVVERVDPSGVTRSDVEEVLDRFRGSIEQVPPMYSAVRVDGERLYEKARRGETVDRPPRQVRIDRFELTDWSPPELSAEVECSKGTYIRALARDLGDELGVGAHLTALRRTRIGSFSVEDSWTLAALEDALS